jgi:hypothetical protein
MSDDSTPIIVEAEFSGQVRRFPIDRHITTYRHVHTMLKEAFQLEKKFVVTYSRNSTCTQGDEIGDSVMTSLSSEWDLDAALEAVLSKWADTKGNAVLRLQVTVIDESTAGRKLFYDASST